MLNKRIVYFSVLFIAFLTNMFFADYALFILLLVMIIVPIASIIYTALAAGKVTVRISPDNKMSIRGDNICFIINVISEAQVVVHNVNINISYTYNNCAQNLNENYILSAKPKDKVALKTVIRLAHSGELKVDISQSCVYDPLMLFKIKLKCSTVDKMVVMPICVTPDFYTLYTEYDNIDDSSVYSQNKGGDDASEIFDIREYRNGDSMNRIHWKAAAKKDELMVKEFSYPIYNSNCIVIDINRTGLTDERSCLDGVFEMAYAIGNLACVREKQFKLVYHSNMLNGLKTFEVQERDDLVNAIQALMNEPSYSENKAFYELRESDLFEASRIFYVTDVLDAQTMEMLDEPVSNSIAVYCISGSQNTSDIINLSGGTIINVDYDDIKQGLKNVII